MTVSAVGYIEAIIHCTIVNNEYTN